MPTVVHLFGRRWRVEWPHRFSLHPTNHGPNGTRMIVTRPVLKFVRQRGIDGKPLPGWNIWFYLPSRTCVASVSYRRADNTATAWAVPSPPRGT